LWSKSQTLEKSEHTRDLLIDDHKSKSNV